VKIGVTGASGKLGRLVIESLLGRCPAQDVVAIVRDPAKVADMAEAGIEVRAAAYDDRQALDIAVAGLDRLLLISSSEVGRRFQQHKNVIDAAKAAGVKQLIYTSAPKATTSNLVLAPEHKATEEYLETSGLPYTVLRNNWYTENYAQSARKAAETGELVAAAGAGRVASAPRADFAEAAAVVLTGEVGGDHAWDYHELAATIAELTGRPCAYKAVEPAELSAAMVAAGADEGTAGFVAADGDLADTTGDLPALLGRPTTPLKETLKQVLE